MTLLQEYRILINKHHSAVETDTLLGNSDSPWMFEKKAKKFWEEFRELERNFITKLEQLGV